MEATSNLSQCNSFSQVKRVATDVVLRTFSRNLDRNLQKKKSSEGKSFSALEGAEVIQAGGEGMTANSDDTKCVGSERWSLCRRVKRNW